MEAGHTRHGNVRMLGIDQNIQHPPRHAIERPVDDLGFHALIQHNLWNLIDLDILVPRCPHLARRREISPQLDPPHEATLLALGHLPVDHTAAGGHPLFVAPEEILPPLAKLPT
jgi:hypothetical protein